MTELLTPVETGPAGETSAALAGTPADVAAAQQDLPEEPLTFVVGAAALASAAAAWLVGGLLQGAIIPRLLGLLGVAVGAGLMVPSLRMRRPSLLQYLVLPVAAVIGLALVAPDAPGGTANVFGLVVDALRGHGLLQPPIPFDPGWRFILVVLFAILSAAAVAVPWATRRPRLAVLLPLPIVVGASLLQPKGSELTSSVVAITLVIGAVAVSYGADLARRTGGSGASFESRRLVRAGGMLAALVIVMVVLSQTSFLFPNANQTHKLTPQKPSVQAMPADRALFRVTSATPGPWRTGVLDVYDGTDWLLPPQDSARLAPLSFPGQVPDAPPQKAAQTTSFHVVDIGGSNLPVPGGAVTVTSSAGGIEYDPRSDTALLASLVPQGFTYRVTSEAIPTGPQLDAAGAAPASMAAFEAVPPAPTAVQALLAQAPKPGFERMQFLRQKLYESVIASGGGSPTSVTPARVNQMLHPNAHASPYEITAAEALLARWAGLPSRMAFGYYGGTTISGGYEVHPRNGAAWLEVWFRGYGWVPLVGVPPRAQASLDNQTKQTNPAVQQSDELALDVFVPVPQMNLLALYEILRWWLAVISPFVVAALALGIGYPVLLKLMRRRRRRRWARGRGPVAAAYVAYADLRDRCYDLNLGDVRLSPLEFAGTFTPDAELDELAWLVTRLVWGDLRRDPQPEDAELAERMSESAMRRIAETQPLFNRLSAAVSRASLRDPYSDELPNVWWRLRLVARLRAAGRRLRPRLVVTRRLRRTAPAVATMLVLCLLLSGCGGGSIAKVPSTYPDRLAPPAPATILGYEFVREPSAELQYVKGSNPSLPITGHVYAIEDNDFIQGSMQVAIFPQNADTSEDTTRATVEKAIGGAFIDYRVGPARLWYLVRPDQRIWLWFPPEQNSMVLFIFRRQFPLADAMVRAVMLYHHGMAPDEAGVEGAQAAACPFPGDLGQAGAPAPSSPSASPGSAPASPTAAPESPVPGAGDTPHLPCPNLSQPSPEGSSS